MNKIITLIEEIKVEIDQLEETRRDHLLDCLDKFEAEVKQSFSESNKKESIEEMMDDDSNLVIEREKEVQDRHQERLDNRLDN